MNHLLRSPKTWIASIMLISIFGLIGYSSFQGSESAKVKVENQQLVEKVKVLEGKVEAKKEYLSHEEMIERFDAYATEHPIVFEGKPYEMQIQSIQSHTYHTGGDYPYTAKTTISFIEDHKVRATSDIELSFVPKDNSMNVYEMTMDDILMAFAKSVVAKSDESRWEANTSGAETILRTLQDGKTIQYRYDHNTKVLELSKTNEEMGE